jgi:hypothetical protein
MKRLACPVFLAVHCHLAANALAVTIPTVPASGKRAGLAALGVFALRLQSPNWLATQVRL